MNTKTVTQLITIGERDFPAKQLNGIPVVTFSDIDYVHGRPKGTAKRNFYKNSEFFYGDVDFYKVEKCELSTKNVLGFEFDKNTTSTIFITETGYLMIVKSLKDKKSWDIQRQLVNSYFKKESLSLLPLQNEITTLKQQQEQLITTTIAMMQAITSQTYQLTKLQQDISTLQRTTYQIRDTINPYKPQSNWKKSATDKIKTLAQELNLEDGKQILRNIYTMMRTDYGKDINTYTDLYSLEHPNKKRLNGIDTVDQYEELQCLFDSILDNYTDLFIRIECTAYAEHSPHYA